MLELVILVAVCVRMAKIAVSSDESGPAWGGITAAICVVCLFLIPWPFARILLAAVIAFIALTVKKVRE